MRLDEMLAMPVFAEFKIIAGNRGVRREVTTVSVMDAPDIYKWMKGGEFLITSGYVIKDRPEYIRFLIQNLEKNGASALGVKIDRFIHTFPQDALEVAEELDFPIIAIPFSFAFTDVINPVLREVIDRQSKKMLYSENVHKAFTKMVLEDEEIPSILEFLRGRIRREVAFVDLCFEHVYFSKTMDTSNLLYQELVGFFREKKCLDIYLERYVHYKMYIDQDIYGYLFLGECQEGYEESLEDYYWIATEQAGTVLILKLQKQLAQVQIEANYRELFVQDMLNHNINSKEEILNRATIYNWNFYAGGIVVIVDIDHFKLQYLDQLDQERSRHLEQMMNRVLNISKCIVGKQYEQYVYSRLSDQIVFIISENYKDGKYFRKRLKEIFEEVKDEIAKNISFTATIGVGIIGEISV